MKVHYAEKAEKERCKLYPAKVLCSQKSWWTKIATSNSTAVTCKKCLKILEAIK